MYLSNEEVRLLDTAVKYFEVGFRSYIAEVIIQKYDTIEKYRAAINSKKSTFNGGSAILSGRINALLSNLSQERQIKKVYKLLSETNNNCKNNIKVEIKEEKSDAYILVSELISITYVFGAELFSDMIQRFSSREEYMYLAEQYRTIRNNLSHPEASISDLNYKETDKFITILKGYIDSKYFWLASKDELQKVLDGLSISINNSVNIINNLSMLPKQKNKFVCRTKEINLVKTYLTGNELGFGRMHYILITGFGGMGKTALITEVIMQLIKDHNNKVLRDDRWFDFILFFSAKEEVLDIDDTNGKINNYRLRSQISTLEDIKQEIRKYLGTEDLIEYNKKGLIVIDNFETLTQEEKEKINNYIIYESNNSIQYVLTSRNEEHIDTNYQLKLKTFNEIEGCDFINKYLEENALTIELTEDNKKQLVKLSKGNTLVLVLSLHRLNQGIDISVIEKELNSIGTETVKNIVSFMSKNSFDEIYNQFKGEEEIVERILQILVMYDDPIDRYSLMILSHSDMNIVDQVVNALTAGLVLEEQREEVQINEFAKTYLLIKFRPNKIEYISKQQMISEYKRDLTIKKNKLQDCRRKNPQIDNIFKEWQPNNIIDELAILEAFEAYIYFNVGLVTNRKTRPNKKYNLKQVNEYFSKIEETSTHPYIYAQKARILLPLLRFKSEDNELIKECLQDSFEKTIISVETQYINIKATISYASILRELGRFYLEDSKKKDYNKSANYSEKSKEIYEKTNKIDKYYYFTLRNLAKAYTGLYEYTKEKEYIIASLKLWNTIQNESKFELKNLKIEAQKQISFCIENV